MDKKFTFPTAQLESILLSSTNKYRILTIEEKRFARYETRYYDTPDYDMYTKHHNRKLNRNKVRFRTYLDSSIHFFEVKFKTNKGRTIKKRLQLDMNDYSIGTGADSLLLKHTHYLKSELQEAMCVYYTRITLVSKDLKERLTIDMDLHYEHGGKSIGFPNMVIAEVKQDKSGTSPFTNIMHELRIKDISISKYCLGVASLVPNVKKNNFKIKLQHVKKLCNATA